MEQAPSNFSEIRSQLSKIQCQKCGVSYSGKCLFWVKDAICGPKIATLISKRIF